MVQTLHPDRSVGVHGVTQPSPAKAASTPGKHLTCNFKSKIKSDITYLLLHRTHLVCHGCVV